MLFSLLFSLALLDPQPQQLPVTYQRECTVRRVILELGPTLTKIGAADVDICRHRLITHFYEEKAIDYTQASLTNASEVAQNQSLDKIMGELDYLRMDMLNRFASPRKPFICAFTKEAFRGMEVAREAGLRLGFATHVLNKRELHQLALKSVHMRAIPADDYHMVLWDKGAEGNVFSTLNQDGTLDTEEFPIKAKLLQGSVAVGIHMHHQQALEYIRGLMPHASSVVTLEEMQHAVAYAASHQQRSFFRKGNQSDSMVPILSAMLETMQDYGIATLFVVPHRSVDGMFVASCDAPVL